MRRLTIHLLAPLLLAATAGAQNLFPEAGQDFPRLPAVSLLPKGSTLQGVMLPQYDNQRRLLTVLRAKLMEIIDEETVDANNVQIDLYRPEGGHRGTITLAKARLDQAKKMLHASVDVRVASEDMSARGTGLVLSFETNRGFLLGPVNTRFYAAAQQTSMNFPPRPAAPRPSRWTAAIATAACLPLIAAPAPLSDQDLAAIDRSAASAAPAAENHATTTSKLTDSADQVSRDADRSITELLQSAGLASLLAETAPAKPPAEEPPNFPAKPGSTSIDCDGGMYFDTKDGVIAYLDNVRLRDREFELDCLKELKVFLEKEAAPEDQPGGITLPPLFSDHMVLQRGKKIPIFGTAAPDASVTVEFGGQKVSTTSDGDGIWLAMLPPMEANATGRPLKVITTETLTINDVLVGDVWLCSGQSNVEEPLKNCGRRADIDGADFPGIRLFTVRERRSGAPTRNIGGKWDVCTPKTAVDHSGTAFYFARKLYQEQSGSVPIGVFISADSGSPIDPWIPAAGIAGSEILEPLLTAEPPRWKPFTLFNGMIYPIAPYGLKGVVWYQGESGEVSSESPDSYYLKLKALIEGWRDLWGDEKLPFYIVQIANFEAPGNSPEPETDGWPLVRSHQLNALGLPNTGLVVTIDIGDAAELHPRNKLDLGDRLARWALRDHYDQPSIVPSGPLFKDVTLEGNTTVCSFDHVGSGLIVGHKSGYEPTEEITDGTLGGFSIAGADGTWHAAAATISDGQVVVSSPAVPEPRGIAYAAAKNPANANLYNKEGLPASPFYVEDLTVRHQITATAGAGGSISPAGKSSFLNRRTALYTFTPDEGHYVSDVIVDGVSVGAVRYFSFDPLYANHTISVSFTDVASKIPTLPIGTVDLSASGRGGSGGDLFGGGKVGKIRQIVASGSVRATRKGDAGKQITATAETAIFDAESGDMILRGGFPAIRQGGSSLVAQQAGLYIRLYKNGDFFASPGRWKTVADKLGGANQFNPGR